VLTPNRGELREVVGQWSSDADLEKRAQARRRELGLDALLVTLSEEGMTLFDDDGAHHEGAKAREVYDVSGAGDTVIATLAVMVAAAGVCAMPCRSPTMLRASWSASWAPRSPIARNWSAA